jgi:hypothetical protein
MLGGIAAGLAYAVLVWRRGGKGTDDAV